MYVSLNGSWKVNHVPFQADIGAVLEENFVPEGWLAARVPEEIHAVLRRAGAIRGHTYGKAAEEERWIEERDWIYYKEFFAPKRMPLDRETLLVCEGLDTFCEIYLNGVFLGSGCNMHRAFRLDIREILRRGERNVLVIRFFSPVKYVEGMDERGIFSITTSDRIFARKAQMNYGWDFCGRTVTVGIWKNIGITVKEEPEIESYYLYTKQLGADFALVRMEAEIAWLTRPCASRKTGDDSGEGSRTERQEEKYVLRTSLFWNGDKAAENEQVILQESGQSGAKDTPALVEMELRVEKPKLWWPAPYGEHPLYEAHIGLYRGEKLVAERRQRFGIRTVEVLQERQADGKSFQFAVNGRKLFLRGANWVPAKMIYTDLTDEDYEVFLEYAARGNLSMLRIWGGGIYENPRMFELCDEKGILIWNDFMFACGIYPQNEEFLENVRLEAQEAVKRCRNYTCLAIWAGDNENGQAYGWAGRAYEFQTDRISNEVLREVCERLDPQRFYLPTSPGSPDEAFKGGDNPSSPYQGDQHIYIMSADPGVNAYRDYGKNYYKRILGIRPRFVSEFGFISLPEKDTFYRFNFRREPLRAPKELEEFLPSCKKYLDAGDFDRAIYYSQLFQAMALKYWIEYFRSLKGTCFGTLYWKFNDPLADCAGEGVFPSHMAAVDMYRNPKMAYYYTRRAYADVIAAFVERENGLDVVGISELLHPLAGELAVYCMDFEGNVLWKKETVCTLGADCAAVLCRIGEEELKGAQADSEYLKLELRTKNAVYENRRYFLDLDQNDRLALWPAGLAAVSLQHFRQGEKAAFRIRLKSARFARNVRLNILDVPADYSDNYFDMDAGEEKEIVITPLFCADEERLRKTVLYAEAENQKRFIVPLWQSMDEM